MDKIAGIILAGGKSSRMGRNKALLPWQNVRLVDYMAGILQEAGIKNIYISGAVEGYQNIPDLLPGNGPVGGICSAVQRLRKSCTKLLFIPVDMPLLSVTCVNNLLPLDNYEAQYFENNPLPCILQLTKNVIAHTQNTHAEIARSAEFSVKKYLSGLNARALKIPPEYSRNISNTNTPQEWQEALHEYSH